MNRLRIGTLISTILLVLCAIFTILSNFVEFSGFWKILAIILSNPFISGVLYTIGLIFIVFDFQITAGKKHIKKDFRCNEILDDSFEEILRYKRIIKDYIDKDNSKKFIIDHQNDLYFINTALSYPNNDILFESLKSSFFFNLNFKLLGILNNIQNRLPNLKEKNINVLEYIHCNCKEPTFTNEEAGHYLIDLKFMVLYWIQLFDYLNYDNTYSHVLVSIYRKNYPDDSYKDLSTMQEHLKRIEKQYGRLIKKEIKKAKKK